MDEIISENAIVWRVLRAHLGMPNASPLQIFRAVSKRRPKDGKEMREIVLDYYHEMLLAEKIKNLNGSS